jgi:2-oxo-4-hydroxy-4-carboxy-5-ureidoimidazoline decarboxylase
MRIEDINILNPDRLQNELMRCCGSRNWVKKMIARRPFLNETELFDVAEKQWFDCVVSDWLEAFSHHPKIGEDKKELEKKFSNTKDWAAGEQKGVQSANTETLEKLVKYNREYEKRFGFIFIVFATGKSASEMLALLEARMKNSPEAEIEIAMGEQNKITLLRLKKLLS